MTTMTKSKKVNFKGPKSELVEILNGLYSTAELSGKAFAVASSKNITTIRTFLEDIEEIAKPSEGFLKLAEKVKAIQGTEGADEKILAIEKEEPELVEARKAQLEAVTSMLTEEVEIELESLTTAILPDEIKSHQINLLTKIIID